MSKNTIKAALKHEAERTVSEGKVGKGFGEKKQL